MDDDKLEEYIADLIRMFGGGREPSRKEVMGRVLMIYGEGMMSSDAFSNGYDEGWLDGQNSVEGGNR
jgi:hypothetical protein